MIFKVAVTAYFMITLVEQAPEDPLVLSLMKRVRPELFTLYEQGKTSVYDTVILSDFEAKYLQDLLEEGTIAGQAIRRAVDKMTLVAQVEDVFESGK